MRTLAVGLTLVIGFAAMADDDKKKEAKKEKKPPVPVAIGAYEIKVPGDWLKQKTSGQFRKFQWGVPTAEGDDKAPVCYISEFAGGVGGLDANIKRWEGEFEEREGEPKKEKIEVEGFKITALDVTGTFKDSMGRGPFSGEKPELRKDWRSIAAMVEPEGGDTVYTFKIVGAKKSVGAQRDDFIAMLKSIKKKG